MINSFIISEIGASIGNTIGNLIGFITVLIGAVALVALGLVIGGKLQPVVLRASHRLGIDETIRETPFAALFPDSEDGVSRSLAVLTKYYIAAVAFVLALEWVAVRSFVGSSTFLSHWAQDVFGYVPPIIIGLIVLFVGFVVANWMTEQVRQSSVANQFGSPPVLASATKAFGYFVVLVIGLDTMGVDVTILYTFAQAIAYAVGLAVALAVGIAFGWGGKDYVAENIDDWVEQSKSITGDSSVAPSDD